MKTVNKQRTSQNTAPRTPLYNKPVRAIDVATEVFIPVMKPGNKQRKGSNNK